ncbi:hypothetical protein KA996_12710 [bacterium]|nr:hypothetical protein [bacterium]
MDARDHFKTGENVSAGVYVCTNCSEHIEMKESGVLKNCPNLDGGVVHNEPNTFTKLKR